MHRRFSAAFKFKRKPAFLLIGDFNLVLIRKATFQFKEGKRDEAVAELELILKKEVRTAKGFQGYISMVSKDSENEALILTLWEDELSFNTSGILLLAPAVRKISNTLEKEPHFENFKLSSTEMYLGAR
jgi:quinol monooxygenase YgiN